MCNPEARLFTCSKLTTRGVEILVTYKNGEQKLVQPGTKLDLINDKIAQLNIPAHENPEDMSLSEFKILETIIYSQEEWKDTYLQGLYCFLDPENSPRIQIIETYHVCPSDLPSNPIK